MHSSSTQVFRGKSYIDYKLDLVMEPCHEDFVAEFRVNGRRELERKWEHANAPESIRLKSCKPSGRNADPYRQILCRHEGGLCETS